MNVLLLDDKHCFVAFALRCMASGHHVKLCMAREKDGTRVKTGDGLIEKIEAEQWAKHASWADLIMLSDSSKWLRELDALKRKGYPVLAPSYDSAQLELEREKGQELFKKNGIKVMPYETFTDEAKAEAYVRKEMRRFVSKPNNNQARELSYVSESPADMVFMLQRWERQHRIKGSFMLQEFVKGVEIGVSGWLGPKGFLPWFEEFAEHKPMMNDGKYVATGETGTVCKYVKDSSLAKELLLPLERDLIKMGHTGAFAVGVIVEDNGDPRPLEATVRLGWPSYNICLSLHPECCEWMAHLLDGEDTFSPLTEHAVGVLVFQSPFPFDDFIKIECGGKVKEENWGIPLYHLNDENPYRDCIAPWDVMEGTAPAMEDGEIVDKRLMVSTGDYLLVANGLGETIREAKKEAYKAIDSLEIPNSIGYRTDIGDRMRADIPKLQEHGFCMNWEY